MNRAMPRRLLKSNEWMIGWQYHWCSNANLALPSIQAYLVGERLTSVTSESYKIV